MSELTERAARIAAMAFALIIACAPASAQTPPTPDEIAAYEGLLAAAAGGRVSEVGRLVKSGAGIEARDGNGRTPLIVAAFRRDLAAVRALIEVGANVNALDNQSYDVLTIAAVLDDLDILKLALASGGNPRAITSPYGGTALIAAAHLGHVKVVEALIAAGAPVDHVNNLGMTALIEAIVLGNGSEAYQATVDALIRGEANLSLADREGATPLALARRKGFENIAQMLEKAGGKP